MRCRLKFFHEKFKTPNSKAVFLTLRTVATSSLFYNMSARHEWHKCDTSNTSETELLNERHECDTSATRKTHVRHEWKILILITTRMRTYFQTPVLTIWQIKDYKERKDFTLRTTFQKCLVPMPKCVWKLHHKI